MQAVHSSKAKARWKILAKSLVSSSSSQCADGEEETRHSVRRFGGFALYEREQISCDSKGLWVCYKHKDRKSASPLIVRLLKCMTTADRLIGFNNTGNICLWPSEEVLADYCLRNEHLFKEKTVCELGAGMTALAGLQVAATGVAKEVLLSDGNQTSVDNLCDIVARNSDFYKNVFVRRLIWSEDDSDFKDLKAKFDVIIIADCLFFVELHKALIFTLRAILKKEGVVVIFSPRRSGTLEKFVELAKDKFGVSSSVDIEGTTSSKHLQALNDPLYDPDIHFPVFLRLKSM